MHHRLSAVLACCLLLATTAHAQDEDVAPVDTSTAPLDDGAAPLDVVTVAARGEREQLDVPRAVAVIGSDEIRIRRPPRSLPELLHRVPGVSGQQTGVAQGSPFIRGLTGYHVLTLIDGIRLNGSFFRTGPNQYNGLIDPMIIDRVEVIRGPGSVLYGSDALGGVISLKTRDPKPYGKGGKLNPEMEPWATITGAVRYGQGMREGAEAAVRPRIEVQGGSGPVAALIGFDTMNVGDREAGRHRRTLHNTQYSEVNGDAKVIYQLSEQDKLTFAVQRTDQRNAPRTHSTIFSESYRGTAIGSDLRRDLDQSRTLSYLQLESTDRGPFDRIKGSVSLQRHYENQIRVRSSGTETRSGFEIWALGAFVEAESDLPLPIDTTLSYGVDYQHDFVSTFQTQGGVRNTRGPIADDSHYDMFGSYLRLEFKVGDVLDAYVGVRYALARIVAREVDPDFTDSFVFGQLVETYDAVLGSTGFALHLLDEVSLVGSASQGFRAPNLDDTTAFRAVSSSSFDSPSPDVDPERSLTLEIGLKWSAPFFRGQVFYAYTFLEDFIQRVPTGAQVTGLDEFTRQNFSDGNIQAIDGQCEILFDPLAELIGLELPRTGLSLFLRGSWTRGEADAFVAVGSRATDHLRRIPPARFAGILRWTEPTTQWLWVEIEGEFHRKQERLSRGDLNDPQRIPPGGSVPYSLWHARIGVNLMDDRIKASVGVENIFDRDYRIHGSGTNGRGRTAVVAMEATW